MENKNDFIILVDLDGTLIDQTIMKNYGKEYAEKYPHLIFSEYNKCWIHPNLDILLEGLKCNPLIKEIWLCTSGDRDHQSYVLKNINYKNKPLYDFFHGHIFRDDLEKLNLFKSSYFFKCTKTIAKHYNWDPVNVLLIDDDVYNIHIGNVIKVNPVFSITNCISQDECDLCYDKYKNYKWENVFNWINDYNYFLKNKKK